MSTTTTHTATPMTSPTSAPAPDETAPGTRGHIGRTVTLTMLSGLLLAVVAVAGPFAGAEEHVITGSVLGAFAASWALLAFLTRRWTDQPQRWAKVPAAVDGRGRSDDPGAGPDRQPARLGVAAGDPRPGRTG